jgi:hypothetical protein
MPRALLAALAVVVAVEIGAIAPRLAALAIVATAWWMALPGVFLARRAFASREPSGIAAWLFGPGVGLGLSVFGALPLWAAGVQGWLAILLAPWMTWSAAWLARRFGGPTLRLPPFDRRDVLAVAVALLVVPVVTWAPYDHVREPVADGEAYRAYFTADFVWGMTVTAELAKGDVPPANPFLRGQPLRYYWMSHFLSGALYRNVRGWGITLEQVLLLNGLAFGLAAVAFLYGLARVSGGSPVFCALAVGVAFLANSYEGLERIWMLHERHAPLAVLKIFNIDAVTRWFYEGMPVDGLQRMLLYQPHHLPGYMLALAALWLVGVAEDVTEISVALGAGVLLGLALLFSSFTAIVVGIAIGTLFVLRLLARRRITALWKCLILGGPVLIAAALSSALGYTDPQQGLLIRFGLNPVAVRQWPLMLVLSFGPLLFAGIAGLLRIRWIVREGAPAAVLVLTAFAFYFLTDVPDQQGVWVGWRSGHLLFIGFLVMGAAGLTAAWQRPMPRWPLALTLLLTVAPAIPTVAIDVYNAQDVTNRAQGPGFPWTLVISPDEREALEWVRRNTPPDAIVQFEPYVRGAGWWCYLTAFGERRMAAGLPGAMIPRRPFEVASDHVRSGIFLATSPHNAHAMARSMGIDYLWLGRVERHSYREAIAAIAKRPDLFPKVFTNKDVTICKVGASP